MSHKTAWQLGFSPKFTVQVHGRLSGKQTICI